MAKPNQPTLLYPNGNEDFIESNILIQWREPSVRSDDGLETWYEIYFTDNYDSNKEPDWISIATVPSGISSYNWSVGRLIRSNSIRVAICSVNIRGERSNFSISANDFSIRKSLPVIPNLISPTPNSRYGNVIPIVFDHSTVKGTFAQKTKYYIYFSSRKANIISTPIAQKIPVGSPPISWDTSLLPPSDDYIVTCYLADDDDNKSNEVVIRNINIDNRGFFIIDTLPPKGKISINNGEEFTKNNNLLLKIFSEDKTTGIHSLKFIEDIKDESGNIQSIEFLPDSFSNTKYLASSSNEGEKTIKLLLQDFGGNRSNEFDNQRIFRTLFQENNYDIADIIIQKLVDNTYNLWVGLNDGSGNGKIYKFDPNGSLISSISYDILEMVIYANELYISVLTEDESALVFKWNGSSLQEAISLSEINTSIISMASFKDSLYLGTQNGELYKFNGSSLSLIRTFDRPISNLFSDENSLYIMNRNTEILYVYNTVLFSEVS